MRPLALALLLAASSGGADPLLQPYALLRQGYAQQDARLAASAYASDAVLGFHALGEPASIVRGRAAIEASFASMFQAWGAKRLSLNFRLAARDGLAELGYYDLRVDGVRACGRFGVSHSGGTTPRFASDLSWELDCAQFDEAPGPLLLDDADTPLPTAFHDALLGRYQGPQGCVWRITRSAWRVQWEDGCSGARRSLVRLSGSQWQARERLDDGAPAFALQFEPPDPGGLRPGLKRGSERAVRLPDIDTQRPLRWQADDGVWLAGTLRAPTTPGPHPGVVLLHGSGPQDRHGYAGLMRRLGDAFVEAGVAVLAFDKRGSGESGGDGDRASFARLAADARSALAQLRAQEGISRVGLAGSSQAGWVAAKAVQQGADPAFVWLLGAAGAGVTVAEQNSFHTEQQLRCASQPEQAVLRQHRAFYALRRQASARPEFVAATRALPESQRAWALPDPRQAAPDAWHQVLELDFDPLPVWAAYRGELFVLLGEHDDATPSALIAQRLRGLPRAQVQVLAGANHLGLLTRDRCQPLVQSERWHPALWQAVGAFKPSAAPP